jgi:plastocyanin
MRGSRSVAESISQAGATLSAVAGLLLSVPALAAQEGAGRIEGTVRFTGAVPPPEKIITSDGMVLMHSDLVVDAKSKGLRHVAVYLDGAPARPLAKNVAKTAEPVVIDQKDMVFMPRVVTVQEGRTVRFDNNDLSNHAVQAMSADTRNVFNILTPMGQPFDFKFVAQKGPVHIGCPIHMWMRAWVYVLPHPWSAVTDAQGALRIDDVPAGTHKLAFVHPDTKLRETKTVTVEAGKTTRVIVEWSRVPR